MTAPLNATLAIPDIAPGEHVLEGTFQEFLRRRLNQPSVTLPLSCATVRVWRCNVGAVVRRDRAGRAQGVFRAGPMVGAADLSGIAAVTIDRNTLGLRLEIECKGAKTPWTDEQQQFARTINEMGGVAVLARYDAAISLKDNVERSVALVDADILRRMARPVHSNAA